MAAMTNSIQFVRMNTGEDLVTEVTEVKNDEDIYFIFSNPLKLVYVMGNKPGVMSISLMQWVFPSLCRDQDFTVYPQDIILMNHASDSMEEFYSNSVEHFNSKKKELEDRTEFENHMIDDSSEAIDMFRELLKGFDKNKLN
jgi:hypothetical protein